VKVVRNDAITVEEVAAIAPDHIVLSPGPCTPNEAGITLDLIRAYAGKMPILGVCLGHQAIGQVFGGQVVRAQVVMHGKVSKIFHDDRGVFAGLSNPLEATRYHSLVVAREGLPEVLEITAKTWNDEIMGLRHKGFAGTKAPCEGVQFHPESIMTPEGKRLLGNFLAMGFAG
jgi:anthranilate synthase/aminodeoxychorismate synthase-like glutamine amidotransferase